MKLTSSLIHAGSTEAGGFTKAQLAVLGIDWPPNKGWLKGLVGKEIPPADYDKFCSLSCKAHRHGSQSSR
jgi:hypothetical protein